MRGAFGALPYYEAQAGYAGQPYFAAQAGLGSPMQRGQGHSYRDGSLGLSLAMTNSNMAVMAIAGVLGILAVKNGYIKKGFLGT